MRVLVQTPPASRHRSVAEGWKNALVSAGHSVVLWEPDRAPAFDAFDAARPDVFVQTREWDRGVDRCLTAYQRTLVVNRRSFQPAFDAVRFRPGRFRAEYACDAVFVGDYRPDKAALLDIYIGPLLGEFDVRLLGSTLWGGLSYGGPVAWESLPDVYASAKVCLDVSVGRLSERFYQILGLGGDAVSNFAYKMPNSKVIQARDPVTPDYFRWTITRSLAKERESWSKPIGASIREHQTYHHRVAAMFREVGLDAESEGVLRHVPPAP